MSPPVPHRVSEPMANRPLDKVAPRGLLPPVRRGALA